MTAVADGEALPALQQLLFPWESRAELRREQHRREEDVPGWQQSAGGGAIVMQDWSVFAEATLAWRRCDRVSRSASGECPPPASPP